jgi:hypothetical protein
MQYKIKNAEALWPKLVEPFKFDEVQNRSVKTSRDDKEGSYELNLIVTSKEAGEIAKKMKEAYAEKAAATPNWPTGGQAWSPKSVDDLFKKDDSGAYIVKCVQKTYCDPKTKPQQFMLDGTKCADDYELTTGSKVHCMVSFFCWKFGQKTGVTIQPKAVMVVEHVEREESNPFKDEMTPGAAKAAKEEANPFAAELAGGAGDNSLGIDDEIPF